MFHLKNELKATILLQMLDVPNIFNFRYKTRLEEIAALLGRCPSVKTASSSFLDDLELVNGIKFTDVLDDFGTVADFCGK